MDAQLVSEVHPCSNRDIAWVQTVLSVYARGDDPARLGLSCDWYKWIGPNGEYTVMAQCRVPNLFDFFLARKTGEADDARLVLFIFAPDSQHGRAARFLEVDGVSVL